MKNFKQPYRNRTGY